MLDKIGNILAKWGTTGIKLPISHNGKLPASARLFFSHISFYAALICTIVNAPQTWTAIAFFSICTVFYMFKDFTKAKIDFDDKSIDLESSHEKES